MRAAQQIAECRAVKPLAVGKGGRAEMQSGKPVPPGPDHMVGLDDRSDPFDHNGFHFACPVAPEGGGLVVFR
jgi:hypothetical protein